MFDHVFIDVSDLEGSRAFYEAALTPLGFFVVMEADGMVGFGRNEQPQFWLADRGTPHATGVHIAFSAESRSAVEAFHREAIAAGGTDNGAPGLRPDYHPTYYAAFVLDPQGHNIEAVRHGPRS